MENAKEAPGYYAIIPANVRYDDRLKPNEKLLYGEITALASSNGICWATNGYFSKLYNVNKVTVSNWINNLIKSGYLSSKIIYKDNSKEIEKRLLSINKNVNSPINKNVNSPINKNVKDNNTRFNNTRDNNTSINNDFDEKSVANKKQNSKEKYDLTSGYRKIVRLLEENGFGLVGGIVSQNISDELKDFAEKSDMDNAVAILEKAITIATLRNANNYGYVSKVTKNWYKDNLFTIDAVEATQKKSKVDKDNKNVYLKKQAKKDETNATRDLSSKRLNDFKKVVEIYTEMFGYVDMPVFGKHTPSNSNNEAWDKLLDGEKNTYDKLRGIVEQHV